MKEITIRVGLNDAVTKQQVHPTKVYVGDKRGLRQRKSVCI